VPAAFVDGIECPLAFLAGAYDPALSEYFHMVGKSRLTGIDLLSQNSCGLFPQPQKLKDPKPRHVRKRHEHLAVVMVYTQRLYLISKYFDMKIS